MNAIASAIQHKEVEMEKQPCLQTQRLWFGGMLDYIYDPNCLDFLTLRIAVRYYMTEEEVKGFGNLCNKDTWKRAAFYIRDKQDVINGATHSDVGWWIEHYPHITR